MSTTLAASVSTMAERRSDEKTAMPHGRGGYVDTIVTRMAHPPPGHFTA
jgi:hypothetical protein